MLPIVSPSCDIVLFPVHLMALAVQSPHMNEILPTPPLIASSNLLFMRLRVLPFLRESLFLILVVPPFDPRRIASLTSTAHAIKVSTVHSELREILGISAFRTHSKVIFFLFVFH